MTHHHHHDNDHDHDHGHDHPHPHGDHSHGDQGEIPFAEKLEKILAHWKQHNDDHVRTYRQWADNARAHGFEAAAKEIEEAARATASVTALFEKALKAVG